MIRKDYVDNNMKHVIIGLLTALVLAAPAQAQRPQPTKERGARYEVVKEWRKAFGELKREVQMLKKQVAELKKERNKRGRRPSIRGKKRMPNPRKKIQQRNKKR